MKVSTPPVTRKELAHKMGIHSRTLYRWLKKENIHLDKRLITPQEQSDILEKFGYILYRNNKLEAIGL
jgi:transposase-like protein